MRRTAFVLACAMVAWCAAAIAGPPAGVNTDPEKVHIVTSDIANFWSASDRADASGDPQRAFAETYFAKGSPGLQGFIPGRLVSPQHLVDKLRKYGAYYRAARSTMARIPEESPRIIADFRRYKKLYPDAVFPDVYFVVGALNSGGTSVDGVGLVLGAEMLSRPAIVPPMDGFQSAILGTPDGIPGLASHEATHYNQRDADKKTLLDNAIYEGTADFMAEMVDPTAPNAAQWAFGCAHEDALWTAFAADQTSTDRKLISMWHYSFDPGPLGAPPFAGYWMGSRIVQTYYATHTDKQKAIDVILHVTDYSAFLKESGYPDKRPPCVPPTS